MISRLLKLHPHKHTGKLIHHRHTSYRALLLVFIVAGAAMVMMHRMAIASDMVVTASVAAPIPAGAPAFTSPAEGTIFTNPLVTFTGTCPIITPSISIVLYEETNLLGSSACQADGTFSITTSISEGTHTYTATVITVTNDIGQSSAPLTLTYQPPAPVQPTLPAPGQSSSVPNVPALNIVSEKPFIIYGQYVNAVWRGYFTGGRPPYVVTVDWGDGSMIDNHKVNDSSTQSYGHSYQESGPYKVIIKLQDSDGRIIVREYATINLSPFYMSTVPSNNIASGMFFGWMWPFHLYLLYLLLLFIMLILWRHEHLHHLQQSRQLLRVGVGSGKYYRSRKKRKKY